MTDTTPGPGHNQPPSLESELADETRPLVMKADDLIAQVGRAAVVDDESAGRATALVVMIRELIDKIDAARAARKKPYDEQAKAVQSAFKAVEGKLVLWRKDKPSQPDSGPLRDLMDKLDAYRRKRDEEAEAERVRKEQEAAAAQAEATRAAQAAIDAAQGWQAKIAAAQRQVDDATVEAVNATTAQESAAAARRVSAAKAALERVQAEAREATTEAEIAARQSQAAAANATQAAAQPAGGLIRSGYGASAGGRKEITVTIHSRKAAVLGAFKLGEEAMVAAALAVYERQAKAGNHDLPGATVSVGSNLVVRKK